MSCTFVSTEMLSGPSHPYRSFDINTIPEQTVRDEQPDRISPQTSRRSFGPVRGELETDVSVHVFSVSAAMVGVCLTVIGIIRVSLTLNAGYSTLADDLLALDAFCFMGACMLS